MDHWKRNQELKSVRLLRHVNANNKYMKNVDKTKDSWYLIYLDKKKICMVKQFVKTTCWQDWMEWNI